MLHNRPFRYLWIGQLFSTFAIWSLRTVLLLWAYRETHSGVAVSLVGAAEVVPLLLLAPLGGVLIDRRPRGVIATGGMACAALLLAVAALPGVASSLAVLIAVAFLVNVAVQVSYTASAALTPTVAGDAELSRANSLSNVILGGGAVVAPGLAALLVTGFGPRGAAVVLVALFAVAGAAYSRVQAPRPATAGAPGSYWSDLQAGLRAALSTPLLRALLLLGVLTSLAFGGLSVLDVVFVTRVLHRPAATVGLLLSAAGAGELLSGIVVTLAVHRLDHVQRQVLGGSIVLAGVAFVLYAAARALPFAVAALFLASLTYPPMNVAFATLRQRATPDALMGRVGSLARSTTGLAMLISLALAGTLTDALGVRTVIAAGGALLLAGGVGSMLVIGTGRAERADSPPRR